MVDSSVETWSRWLNRDKVNSTWSRGCLVIRLGEKMNYSSCHRRIRGKVGNDRGKLSNSRCVSSTRTRFAEIREAFFKRVNEPRRNTAARIQEEGRRIELVHRLRPFRREHKAKSRCIFIGTSRDENTVTRRKRDEHALLLSEIITGYLGPVGWN